MLKVGNVIRLVSRGRCSSSSRLNLYDLVHAKGVAMDLSHIETNARVKGFQGPSELPECLNGVDIVVVPAGIPRKPGMSRDDLFNTNATIVAEITRAVAENCPKAMLCIITNPVNSTVPIAAEILKSEGVFDPRKVFGVTTLDVCRANTFISNIKGCDVRSVACPVIGGHSGVTILPVFSHCQPHISFPLEKRDEMTKRVQEAGTEVVNAKEGAGSATLSMAYAGARFVTSLMEAMSGRSGIVECAYVPSKFAGLGYFSWPIELGPMGVFEEMQISKLNEFELRQLELVIKELQVNIAKGEAFAKEYIRKR